MNIKDKIVVTQKDVLELLDTLFDNRGKDWWTEFYNDRSKKCPFFVNIPDENLAEIVEMNIIKPSSSILELGCGNGRNAIYLCDCGFEVDAIDFSNSAIQWAAEKALDHKKKPGFHRQSIFEFKISEKPYDFIYDCGCFHHQPPHRRPCYLEFLKTALKPEGLFGLVCFSPDGGSGLTDLQVYEERSLKGGLGFTEEQLRHIFEEEFDILKIRKMKELQPGNIFFGKDFLWTVLMKKKI